jgi:hypothetical protein
MKKQELEGSCILSASLDKGYREKETLLYFKGFFSLISENLYTKAPFEGHPSAKRC